MDFFCFVFFPFHCFNSIPPKNPSLVLCTHSTPSFPCLPFSNARNRTRSKEREEKQEEEKKKKLTAFPTNNIVGNGRCDLQLSFTILGTDEMRRGGNHVLLSVRIGLDGELSQPVFFTMIPAFSSSFLLLRRVPVRFIFLFFFGEY